MKVALVHDWLNGMRGGEKVLEHVSSLFPQAPVYTLHSDKEKLSSILRKKEIIHSFIQKLPFKSKLYRYYLPLFPYAIEKLNFADYETIISTSHCAAKGIKPGKACHICYSFTPMRYVWDLPDDYFGSNPLKRLLMTPFLSYLKKWDHKSSMRVYRFITISRTTQERIKKYYQRDAMILYPPCNHSFKPEEKKDNFYLIVSALVPYKKIDLAISVFNELGYPLKIAGIGPEENRLKRMARSNISFKGWISENEKIELYKKAKGFIFPGVEDFGITPLESIAFGTPVIAYKKGGVLETVTEETGIFFEDQTEKSLKDAVISFEKNPFCIKKKPDTFDLFSPETFKKKFKVIVDETCDAFQKGKKLF